MTIVVRRRRPRAVPKPLGAITCGRCANWWTGGGRCHCTGCHQTFSGLSLFDAHHRGGKCLAPTAVVKQDGRPVMRAVERPYGVLWVGADEQEPCPHGKVEWACKDCKDIAA